MPASDPHSNQCRFRVAAPPALVFPLFTAEGERRWVPGWNPTMLSGETARGSAFRTVDAQGRATLWVVADFDPSSRRVSYARFAEGRSIGLVDVSCTAAAGGGTTVEVRYTLTGVDDAGESFVAEFLADAGFSAMIGSWERAVNAAVGDTSP